MRHFSTKLYKKIKYMSKYWCIYMCGTSSVIGSSLDGQFRPEHHRFCGTTRPFNYRPSTDIVRHGRFISDLFARQGSPVSTKHLYDICTMLAQRRRGWADVVQMLYKCFVFAGSPRRRFECQGSDNHNTSFVTISIITVFWWLIY